jgi:hypothetical protein
VSVEERVPLTPVKGLRREVVIPPPPPRRAPERSTEAADPTQDRAGARPAGAVPDEEPRPLTSLDGPSPLVRTEPETRLQPPPATVPGAPRPSPPAAPRRSTTGESVSQTTRQIVGQTAELMRATTLSLPAAVVTALKARAVADRVTHAEVLLDALSASAGDLADLVRSTRPRPTREGLFLRLPTRGPAEPMATLSVRMLTRNVETIDDLVATTEAASRSLLCTAALRRYLDL